MMRHCDGTDPNLIRKIEGGEGYETCTCGLTFDDTNRMTVYPHIRLAGEAIEMYALRGH